MYITVSFLGCLDFVGQPAAQVQQRTDPPPSLLPCFLLFGVCSLDPWFCCFVDAYLISYVLLYGNMYMALVYKHFLISTHDHDPTNRFVLRVFRPFIGSCYDFLVSVVSIRETPICYYKKMYMYIITIPTYAF